MNATAPIPIEEKRKMLEQLIEKHETELLRHATGLTGQPQAAQQVVQTVFTRLAGSWHNGSKPSPLIRYWLYRETYRRASGFLFHHDRQPAAPVLRDPKAAAIWRGIYQLMPREREAVLLRLQEGFTTEEIARITGNQTADVRRLLDGAIRKMAVKLQGGSSS